jgi:hypothetical protein
VASGNPLAPLKAPGLHQGCKDLPRRSALPEMGSGKTRDYRRLGTMRQWAAL